MARGWESKSVEAQQADAIEKSSTPRVKLSPEAIARKRECESLQLARNRVAQQLESSQNPHHQEMLRDSLAELDKRLKALE